MTLSAEPDAHFVGQRVVIYPDVHGVVRALRDGKLTSRPTALELSTRLAPALFCSRSETASLLTRRAPRRGRR